MTPLAGAPGAALLLEGLHFPASGLRWIHLAWLLPALVLVYVYSFYRKRMALRLFAGQEVLSHLIPSVSWGRQYARSGLVLGGLLLTVVAILRPQWGADLQQIRRKGIDLVVLLDLSKSMLAEDMGGSRLDWAKADLGELLGGLTGDRIALVAFAGRAEVRCPLTFDYGFFRRILDELHIGSVGLGGTLIGDAIQKGLECFQDNVKNHKAILLITDGEDHESFVKEAAEKARDRGVRVFSIGVGDTGEGKRIPLKDEHGNRVYLQDKEGKEVWTKMDPRVLKEAAVITDGGYAPAYLRREGEPGGAVTSVREIYGRITETVEKRDLEAAKEERFQDRFQWFLVLAWLLLALEPLVTTRRRPRREAEAAPPGRPPGRRPARAIPEARKTPAPPAARKAAVAGGLAIFFLFSSAARAGQFENLLVEGNHLYAEGKYPEAEEKYLQAKTERQDAAEPSYNIANTYFQRQDYQKAIDLYSEALKAVRERPLEARIRYNLACARAQDSERFVGDLTNSENLEKGVELLREAIGGFRDVLEIESGHPGAQRNLAVSQLRIKNLLDQLKRLREEAEKKAKEEKDKKKSPVELLKELIAEEKAEIELTGAAGSRAEEIEKLGGYRKRIEALRQSKGPRTDLETLLADSDFTLGGAEASEARKLEAAGDGPGAERKLGEAGERIENGIGERSEERGKTLEKDRSDQTSTMGKAAGLARGLRDLAEGKSPSPPAQAAPGGQPPAPAAGGAPQVGPEVRDRLVLVAEKTEESHSKMGKALEGLPGPPASPGGTAASSGPPAGDLGEVRKHQEEALRLLEEALAEAEKLPQEKPPPQDQKQDQKDKDKKDQDKKDQEKKQDQDKKKGDPKKDDPKKDQDQKQDQDQKDASGKDQKKDDKKLTREEAEQALRKFREKDADRRRTKERKAVSPGSGRAAMDKDW